MTKEALKLALEALEYRGVGSWRKKQPAITAIKEALAQPEPWEKFCDSNCVWTDHHPDCKLAESEPVAFASHGVVNWIADKQFQHEADLYIAPLRPWVNLMRGVRVDGETVVISVIGGNDMARALCGELINEMEKNK